jgi:N-methylhydantoinase B
VTNGSGFPIEVSEAQLPVLFHRVELWSDSGGAGTWRGGLGFTTELEWRGGEANVRFRRERHKFTPWGVQGGLRSLPCTTELQRPDGVVLRLSGKARMPLGHGDRIRVFTTGSGGYGLPTERDPERVRADVLDGKVSLRAAHELYGVVICGEQVDVDATQRLRAEMSTRAVVASVAGERAGS